MSTSIVSRAQTARGEVPAPTAPQIVPESVRRVGFWAALAMALFYSAWDLGFVAASFLKFPSDLIVQWAPSVFIPATWIVLMVSVDRWAPEERRVFSQVAVVFGAVYAALSTSTYFVQLTVAIPKQIAGAGSQLGPLLWTQPQSLPYATDILGYTFMSLSALFAAFVFVRLGLERWVRWTLIAAGLPAFVLPIQMFWLPAEIAAAPTLFAFPLAGVLLALLLRRSRP